MRYPRINLTAMVAGWGVDLPAALRQLQLLYDEVDARNAHNTKNLDLPCHRGCSMCCHESVFLTPLEFLAAWDYAQTHLSDPTIDAIVQEGLRLYEHHQARIEAMDAPPPQGHKDHFALARDLKFTCPLLSKDGACQVYPARELLARLFGCSLNEHLGIYGCHLVGAHLANKTVTLLPARPTARRLDALPLTHKRQVYPYYFHVLYGDDAPSSQF